VSYLVILLKKFSKQKQKTNKNISKKKHLKKKKNSLIGKNHLEEKEIYITVFIATNFSWDFIFHKMKKIIANGNAFFFSLICLLV